MVDAGDLDRTRRPVIDRSSRSRDREHRIGPDGVLHREHLHLDGSNRVRGVADLEDERSLGPSIRKLRSRSPSSVVASPSTPNTVRATSTASAAETSGGRASRTLSLTAPHDNRCGRRFCLVPSKRRLEAGLNQTQSTSWSRSQCSGQLHSSVSERVRRTGRSVGRGGFAFGLRSRIAGGLDGRHAALLSMSWVSDSNCSSSVDPARASVDAVPPVIVCSTWSK